MTKEQIIDRIRETTDSLSKKQASDIMNKFLDILKQTLRDGEEIKISSFGKFYVQNRKPRMGRNPKTGEDAAIKEGKTIKFRPGKPLRTSVLT
ncbi:HU family DNA-binding protein [bacterium]|nr:HU family DNA-binding protein [bacterium]